MTHDRAMDDQKAEAMQMAMTRKRLAENPDMRRLAFSECIVSVADSARDLRDIVSLAFEMGVVNVSTKDAMEVIERRIDEAFKARLGVSLINSIQGERPPVGRGASGASEEDQRMFLKRIYGDGMGLDGNSMGNEL